MSARALQLARTGLLGLVTAMALQQNIALAQEPTTEDLQREIVKRDAQIQLLLKRMDALEKMVKTRMATSQRGPQQSEPAVVAAQKPAAPIASGPGQSDREVAQQTPPATRAPPASPLVSPGGSAATPTTPEESEDAMIARALENTLIDRGGQLLPPYVFQLVPDFSFSYQSLDQLAFVNNGANIARQQSHRDLLEWGLGFRIGLPWETQFGIRVPFGLDYGTATIGGQTFNSNRGGLGNISISLQKQVLHEKGWVPDLLVNVNYSANTGSTNLSTQQVSTFPFGVGTGSGFNQLGAGFTVLKRQDPLVFLGGFQYTHSFPSTINRVSVSLGDQYFFRAEAILAASPDTSLRVGWLTTFQQGNTFGGFIAQGSNQTISNLEIGVGSVITPKIFLDAALLVGLTHDTPDFTALLTVPFRF